MENEPYSFRLGDFECVALWDGNGNYDLDDMVANAPLSDVEAALQAHGLPTQSITTPYTHLHVQAGKHQVLCDMGGGSLFSFTGNLHQSMEAAGILPEAIDSIFITHAHPDHIGGALDASGGLVFPQATYYICQAEWDFWFSEPAPSQAGEWMTKIARQVLTPLKDKMVLLKREQEILPGVSVLFAPGHTPGHMVISISSGGESLLYTGDTVLLPLHLEYPDWSPVYDILPEMARDSKSRIFDLAASSRCRVIGQQFPPFPSLGRVIKKDMGWEWQPVEA